jgi:hypothetical protein
MHTEREATIAAIEQWAGTALPSEYRQFLLSHDENIFGGSVLIYPAENVIERNETLETKTYCPGHLVVGDDSGGQAIVISLSPELKSVFLVSHGYMDPDGFRLIGEGFSEWIANECPVVCGI